MIVIEELEPLLFPVVNLFYKENGHKGKARANERVFLLKKEQTILAALRACPKANGYLIRSVWVATDKRRLGLGTILITEALNALRPAPCWCYPYEHLQAFYEASGLRIFDVSDAPDDIAIPYLAYRNRGERFLLMAARQR